MRRSTALACITAVAGLAFAGCGGNESGTTANASHFHGDQQKVAQVVDRLAEASRHSDGTKICDELFTANLRASVQKASSGSCAAEVAKKVGAGDAAYTVRKVTVKGNLAGALVVDQARRSSSLILAREAGAWRISRIAPATA
jgi:hypothetical protein